MYRRAMNATAVACACLMLAWASPARSQEATRGRPLRLAIAGLVHGHVNRFLGLARDRADVELVGIFDPDPALHARIAQRYGVPAGAFFTDLESMLDRTKPEAVAAFTSTDDHPMVVEACAARRVHVMMEKPLAVSTEHARAIRQAADRGRIHVFVNYETTWYRSRGAVWTLVKEERASGDIRKIVAMDGHPGPKEIGVGPEFLGWLTDPLKNGGGALFDFGCYGANLMTWLMDDQRPLAVTAMTQTVKPDVYSRVDDEATVVVQYPKAQGIIQASWNWPFNRKDLEVYGERGYVIATGGDGLRVRLPGKPEEARSPDPLPPDERDELSYLIAGARGSLEPSGLSSLANNLIVVEILEAARESARTGTTVRLAGR